MRGRRRLIAAAEIKARRRRDQSRTTGILPVPEHGLEGRGTKFVRRTKILLTSSTVVSEGFRDLVCGEIEAGSQLLRNARVPFFFQRRGKVGTCVPVPVSLVLVKSPLVSQSPLVPVPVSPSFDAHPLYVYLTAHRQVLGVADLSFLTIAPSTKQMRTTLNIAISNQFPVSLGLGSYLEA